jgi:hypothetical protein
MPNAVITTFSIPRPSKMYPNRNFWFENKPSGNPDANNLAILIEGYRNI